MARAKLTTEQLLRRNLGWVATRGGMTDPSNAQMMHGTLLRLKRIEELPTDRDLLALAADAGVSAEDALRLEGVALSVRHGERNYGRLSVEANGAALAISLTREEASVARGALYLLLRGPFCNLKSHRPPGDDPFWELHAITGHDEAEYRYLLAALDDRRNAAGPREANPGEHPENADS